MTSTDVKPSRSRSCATRSSSCRPATTGASRCGRVRACRCASTARPVRHSHLTGPERVRIATTAYAETEDHTGRFYDECCRLAPDLRAEQTTLYAAYTSWCHNEGALVMSSRAFAARTRELVGLASPKEMEVSNQRKYYPGIGLLAATEAA